MKCKERSCVFPAVEGGDQCVLHLRDSRLKVSLTGSTVQLGMAEGCANKRLFRDIIQIRKRRKRRQEAKCSQLLQSPISPQFSATTR